MSSDAVAEMAFIDLAFHQNDERSDVVQFRVKLRVKKNDNLRIVLGRAVRKLLLNEETEINKSGEVEDDGDVSALTNLSDLPSHKTESEKGLTKTEKGKRDTKIAKELGKNIFAARSVRSFVTCYHCCKRRCIYSPSQEGYIQAQAARALKEKLESVSGRYSCGDLLFEDSDPLSKVLVQKLNLTCESQIEKGYYNNASDTRSLNLKDICIHCGELDMNETGMDAFLLRQDQLSELGVTNGYKCFPICVDCLKVKKLKIVTTGKKDVAKAREEDARRKA